MLKSLNLKPIVCCTNNEKNNNSPQIIKRIRNVEKKARTRIGTIFKGGRQMGGEDIKQLRNIFSRNTKQKKENTEVVDLKPQVDMVKTEDVKIVKINKDDNFFE